MRTSTLALVGLVAAATALPASQGNSRITKRDEILGRETYVTPLQKKAIESGIEQLKSFLAQYGNGKVTVDTTGPPGVISTFTPGKNKRHETPEDMFLILDQWNTMTKEHYSKSHPPPAPVYLVACQLAELLKEEGYDIDTSILDVWSTFKISDRSIQARQDGIFALPGSCNIDDIIGLETILATIILIYGEDPPQHINSLRNAVLAALLFCGVADAETGGIIPDRPGQGSPVVPDYPSPGGPMVPDKPSSGGSVVPDQPESGGAIVPDKPSSGGRMNPDQPDQGGSINPDPPSEGGRLIPSD